MAKPPPPVILCTHFPFPCGIFRIDAGLHFAVSWRVGASQAAGVVQVVVMSIWRRRPGPEQNYGIATGQRFFSVGRTNAVWEVVTVARYSGDVGPHVRLARVGSEHDAKTVSLDVLRDRRFYQPTT